MCARYVLGDFHSQSGGLDTEDRGGLQSGATLPGHLSPSRVSSAPGRASLWTPVSMMGEWRQPSVPKSVFLQQSLPSGVKNHPRSCAFGRHLVKQSSVNRRLSQKARGMSSCFPADLLMGALGSRHPSVHIGPDGSFLQSPPVCQLGSSEVLTWKTRPLWPQW